VPSRPGEFHSEPLTDPDLNLSIHPARVTARRLPPSAEPSGSCHALVHEWDGDRNYFNWTMVRMKPPIWAVKI
jgi:hypothetical protein